MNKWSWPTDFPQDCPPDAANPANGRFYRISDANPPSSDFFLGQIHTNTEYSMMQISRGHVTLCTIHGLSVRTDLQKAEELQNNFPQLGKLIAALDLTDVDGVVFVGGGLGTHATWWRADGSTATPVIVSGPNI